MLALLPLPEYVAHDAIKVDVFMPVLGDPGVNVGLPEKDPAIWRVMIRHIRQDVTPRPPWRPPAAILPGLRQCQEHRLDSSKNIFSTGVQRIRASFSASSREMRIKPFSTL
jgi:hypothetical protein